MSFTANVALNNGMNPNLTPTNGMAASTRSNTNSLLRNGEKAQIRSSMDMVRVYNYGPQSLQQSNNNPTLVVIMHNNLT